MLTKKQNFLETIHGGHPDRFVNQFEALHIVLDMPLTAYQSTPFYGCHEHVNSWGITCSWPKGTPGYFPVHTPEKTVIKDIEHWRDYVKFPKCEYNAEQWAPYIGMSSLINRNEQFITPWIAPGIFEQCHYLMEIQNCLTAFYEYPDEMHELIEALTDWELRLAANLCEYLKPDAIFHHDDWGSHHNTFLSPAMWREFIKPAYEKIYGYYKSHGVKLIIHHNDAFSATLVPDMIDLGIDVWQGAISTNNVPELMREYGKHISFMGCIDSALVDRVDWTPEAINRVVREQCDTYGTQHMIYGASIGLPISSVPGVYQALTDAIDNCSVDTFGFTLQELRATRKKPRFGYSRA